MIFDTIQGFHGFESRPQHFFEPRISSPLQTTRAVDKIIVWGMYGPPPGRTGPRNTEKVIRVRPSTSRSHYCHENPPGNTAGQCSTPL